MPLPADDHGLPQQHLIARLRERCAQDSRLVAAMLYGSWTRGEGDEFSDVDVVLFFDDRALLTIEPCVWLGQLAPLLRCYRNEWGNVTGLFDMGRLIRAEFHFDPASRMAAELGAWRGAWFPDLADVILVDRTEGALNEALRPLTGERPTHDTANEVEFLVNSVLNWALMGLNLLQRGSVARAHEVLALVLDHLLRAARLDEGQTGHWLSPASALERELSPEGYRRYQRCTAPAQAELLRAAYDEALQWSEALLQSLCARHDLPLPADLLARIRAQSGLPPAP